MRISDWSSDVCSSDLRDVVDHRGVEQLSGGGVAVDHAAVGSGHQVGGRRAVQRPRQDLEPFVLADGAPPLNHQEGKHAKPDRAARHGGEDGYGYTAFDAWTRHREAGPPKTGTQTGKPP